jgi:hypothetical protein
VAQAPRLSGSKNRSTSLIAFGRKLKQCYLRAHEAAEPHESTPVFSWQVQVAAGSIDRRTPSSPVSFISPDANAVIVLH